MQNNLQGLLLICKHLLVNCQNEASAIPKNCIKFPCWRLIFWRQLYGYY
jgi:hypothetical protein